MKRFVTLLTVSITMAGLAFAGHPVVEPEVESGVGFPFHPGAYISSSSSSETVWNECFCLPANPQVPNYTEFPTTGDPYVIPNFHALRMNGTSAVPTYLQSPASYNYDGMVLDMTFYFAVSECAGSLGYYITPGALTAAPTSAVLPVGLSFIIDRNGSMADIKLYDDGTLVNTASLPVYDSNFHLLRVIYDETNQKVKVTLFDMMESLAEDVIMPWTSVSGPSNGYVGFGGISTQGCYQYIDDICLLINTNDEYEVDASDSPVAFELAQNYPNPFNPATTISFNMPETGMASLKVYDLAGHVVATLVNGMANRGENRVVFDGSRMSSGVYFYTLETAGVSQTRKMVLAK